MVRIIANIGKLGGTANTYGLEYPAEEVLPHLPNAMNGRRYEIHILGAGELHADISRNLLSKPYVKMRGFVDDIDEEMAQSGIFVCVNNATAYNVGHTRYLHAWSLGCCVISHTAFGEAMPEIQHEVNALLGRDGEEIAKLIAQAR
jgi:Glycosyl transferases group 1